MLRWGSYFSRVERANLLANLLMLPSLLLSSAFLFAQEVPACPDPSVLDVQQAEVVRNIQQRSQQIQLVLDGQSVNTPLNGLFTIDLTDDKAIAARVDFLKSVTSNIRLEPPPLLDCVNDPLALVDAWQKFVELRLKFLTIPAEQRRQLVNLTGVSQSHDAALTELNTDKVLVEATGTEAAKAQAEAEQVAIVGTTLDERQVAALRALIESQRKTISEQQLKVIADIEQKFSEDDRYSEVLANFAASSTGNLDRATLLADYQKVTGIWRSLATDMLHSQTLVIPALPAELGLSKDEIKQYQVLAEFSELLNAKKQLESERIALIKSLTKRIQELHSLEYRLLVEAGRVRSTLMYAVKDAGGLNLLTLNKENLNLIFLEIQITPIRLAQGFFTKVELARRMLSLGSVDEALAVLKSFSQVLLIALLLVVAFVSNNMIGRWSNSVLISLLKARSARGARVAAISVRRIIPFLPLVFIWVLTMLADSWLPDSEMAWVLVVLPVIRYYLVYRIFINFLNMLLSSSLVGERAASVRAALQVLEKGLRTIARYSLLMATLAYGFAAFVGRLLVHQLIVDVVIFGGGLIAFWLAWKSRKLVIATVKRNFSEKVAEKVEKICLSWFSPVATLLVVIYLCAVSALQVVKQLGGEVELAKRLSALLFLRRVQAQKGNESSVFTKAIPEDYLRWFDLYNSPDESVLIEQSTDDIAYTIKIINDWQEKKGTANSLAIYGYKGTGKSTELGRLTNSFPELRVITVSVLHKLTTKEQAISFFGDIFDCDLRSGADALLAVDKQMPPTLLLLDDAHNLFLRKQGGFGAFKFFCSLLNLNTDNIFWCAAFNLYPWLYLTDVFASERPFRQVHELESWTDTDIEELITRRHARGGYRLRYDRVIMAAGVEDDEYVESRFFRLLWEQSRGIPRAALTLWLNSLRYDGGRILRVTLPELSSLSKLAALPSDQMFVFAAIVRHENLSASEAVEVTGLPEALIRHVLGLGSEIGVLEMGGDKCYRVSPIWSMTINQYLQSRNLIYE